MPELNFQVEGAAPERFAAVPTLLFKLRVSQTAAEPTPIHSVVLRSARCASSRRDGITRLRKKSGCSISSAPPSAGGRLR